VVLAILKELVDGCPAALRNEVAARFDCEARLLHIVSSTIRRW
jgi:hypothetical protein